MAGWITVAEVRRALQVPASAFSDDLLQEYVDVACTLIDVRTNRMDSGVLDDALHRVDGVLPTVFRLAAKETVKLWWRQATYGPRDPANANPGVPQGADLPAKVKTWLEPWSLPNGFA